MKTTLAKCAFTVFTCMLLLSVLTGCGVKTAQTAEGFTQIMEDAGFDVEDVAVEPETDGRTSTLAAVGKNYQMDYYAFTDNETCADFFQAAMEELDEAHLKKTFSIQTTMNNYCYYAFNADGDFHVIVRVDNTMLCCTADKTYKSEIVDLLKTLGYK